MDADDLRLFSSPNPWPCSGGSSRKNPRGLKRGDRVDLPGGQWGTVHGVSFDTHTVSVNVCGIGRKEFSLDELR